MGKLHTNNNTTTWPAPRILALFCLLLTSVIFSGGYALHGIWYISLVVILLGILWIIGNWRSWAWLTGIVFTLHTLVAAAGFLFTIESISLLSGMLFALFAWDLDALTHRYRHADLVKNQTAFIIRHLLRLLLVGSIGLVLATVALTAQIELGFGWLVLLAAIAVIGLSYGIGYLLREKRE